VDPTTIDAYDLAPEGYASEWDDQAPPGDLHDLLLRHLRPGPTADIGCGAGRDTAWLVDQGFDTVGFDASEGLLAEARRRHPAITFRRSVLPGLAGIADGSFRNVVCETVVMHLAVSEIPAAVERLLAILRPGGTLYLSWRVTEGADVRLGDGRLYSAFPASLVTAALDGAVLLHDSEGASASSGRTVHRLVAAKPGLYSPWGPTSPEGSTSP
jgi:SAM-dependent methyltransferase